MSFGSCSCPAPSALTSILTFNCGEDFGQIQKIVVQRRQSTPTFATLTAIQTLSNWTTLLSAVDSTKVVVTPIISGFVIPEGEPILEAADTNKTPDGAALILGAKAPRASGQFRSLPAATLRYLKALNCETNLWVFLINQFGRIIGSSSDGTRIGGIPVVSWFVGDPGNDGFATNDMTPVGFSLRYGWRDYVKFATPSNFNALTDLSQAGS